MTTLFRLKCQKHFRYRSNEGYGRLACETKNTRQASGHDVVWASRNLLTRPYIYYITRKNESKEENEQNEQILLYKQKIMIKF